MLTQGGFLEAVRRLLQTDERWRDTCHAERGPRKEVRLKWTAKGLPGLYELHNALRKLAAHHGWLVDTSAEDYTELRPGYEF